LAEQRHRRGSGSIPRARGGRPGRVHRPGDRSHRAVTDHGGGMRPRPQHAAGGVPVTPRRWLALVPLRIGAVGTARRAVPGSAAVQSPAARSPAAHRLAPVAARATPSCNPVASSLRPTGSPRVTPGSFMAKIRHRGYLIAGVTQSTYPFGFVNPLNGKT